MRQDLPVYKVLKAGRGSYIVVVSREKPNGNLQFISVLVDAWKMGLKDCFGMYNVSKFDFHNSLKSMLPSGKFEEIKLEEAQWLVKHGLRIASAVGTPVPKEFWKLKYILGDMDDVEVKGSLYKCFECGKGELSEQEVERIREVVKRDIGAGVCGMPRETKIFFMCESCRQKGKRVKAWQK